MIHVFQCRACGTTYPEQQTNGSIHAHVCGPLPARKKDPERERPDKRDENPQLDRHGHVVGIRSAGAGVVCISDGRIDEPTWISALYKRIEKEDAGNDA